MLSGWHPVRSKKPAALHKDWIKWDMGLFSFLLLAIIFFLFKGYHLGKVCVYIRKNNVYYLAQGFSSSPVGIILSAAGAGGRGRSCWRPRRHCISGGISCSLEHGA
jgi:hypothetical protein